jgi:hypothetical protein
VGPSVEPDPDGRWLTGHVTEPNLAEAQRRWALVTSGYSPIDWQLDFKSGWRWSATVWYRDLRILGPPGSDPKTPWELGRLQHLSQLAVAAAAARAGAEGFEEPDVYAQEFRNQVLDFTAANPPRHGINWVMPMEVAIRLANLLIAWDIFAAGETVFDEPFERYFRLAVLDHARFVARNLEWHERWRGNHFLADLAGLAMAAAYLPDDPESSGWAATAHKWIEIELREQFWPDGSNAEGSTSYHFLATELVTYVLAGLAARGEYSGRRMTAGPMLRKAAQFSMDITTPAGQVVQVGDNDSGRFLKLIPNVRPTTLGEVRTRLETTPIEPGEPDESRYWLEEHLDHRPLVAAINGIAPQGHANEFSQAFRFVSSIVNQLSGGADFSAGVMAETTTGVHIGTEADFALVRRTIHETSPASKYAVRFDLRGWPFWEELTRVAYPDFGLFIVRGLDFFASIRCGPVGQGGRGGHAHNDQLALELWVGGSPWVRDPGAYLYTPLPGRRNEYRSTRAHFTPRIGPGEPRSLTSDIFALGPGGDSKCLYWGESGFAGRCQWADGRNVVCLIEPGDAGLIVWYAVDRATTEFRGEIDWRDAVPTIAFSPGYGMRERHQA